MKSFVRTGVFLVFLLFALSVRADWQAARDLAANELPNGNGVELVDPNPTVPQWSYGYRGTLNSLTLTLYTSTQHTNVYDGNANVQGFTLGDGNDAAVNLGGTPASIHAGLNFLSLPAGDMVVHPGPNAATNRYEVVRWTAPSSGLYQINAFWTDIDPNGGDGAEGVILVNGSGSLFDVNFNNGTGTSANLTHAFSAGDLVDFIVGPRSAYQFDSTAFNATITAVPESSTWVISALAAVMLIVQIGRAALFTRRSNNKTSTFK